jgi:hypothetical protein
VDRIESWLKVGAPNSYASLRPPATPEQLAGAQARMGISRPEELAALRGRWHSRLVAARGAGLAVFALLVVGGTWWITRR